MITYISILYAIVLIFVFSALLTPPDVLTQFLMAGPLIILYGVSIYIAKVFNPYVDPFEDDEDDEEDEDESDEEDEEYEDEDDIAYNNEIEEDKQEANDKK